MARTARLPVHVSPALLAVASGVLVGAVALGGGALDLAAAMGVVAAALLAHELAHALAARWCGYRVEAVHLGLLGGGTAWSGPDAPPEVAALVAAAGPGASALLACAFVLAGRATGGLDGLLLVGATVTIIDTVVNLVPVPGSDGRQLLRAVRAAAAGGAGAPT